MARLDLDHAIEADDVRTLGDVLLADQHGVVARIVKRVDEVLAVVVERPAAVGEPHHAVVVPVLARQQTGARGRAGGRGAEGLAEQDSLVGQALDVGCGHRVPVGLHVAPGVVRVQVEDVGGSATHMLARRRPG